MEFDFSNGLTAKTKKIFAHGLRQLFSSDVCQGVFLSHKKDTFLVGGPGEMFSAGPMGNLEIDKSGRRVISYGDFKAVELGVAKSIPGAGAPGGTSDFCLYQLLGLSITSDYCRRAFGQERAEDGWERSEGELVHLVIAASNLEEIELEEISPELKIEYHGPNLKGPHHQNWEIADHFFGPDHWLNDPFYSELENDLHAYDDGLLIRDGAECFWVGKFEKFYVRGPSDPEHPLAMYRPLTPKSNCIGETIGESFLSMQSLSPSTFTFEEKERRIPLRSLINLNGAPSEVLEEFLKDRDCYFRWVDLNDPDPLRTSISYPRWSELGANARDIRNHLRLRINDLSSQTIFAFTEEDLPNLFSTLKTFVDANHEWSNSDDFPSKSACFLLTYEVSSDQFVLDAHISTYLSPTFDSEKEKIVEIFRRLFSFFWPTTWSGEMLLELAVSQAGWKGEPRSSLISTWNRKSYESDIFQVQPHVPLLGKWVAPDKVRVSLRICDLDGVEEPQIVQVEEIRTTWLSSDNLNQSFNEYLGPKFFR